MERHRHGLHHLSHVTCQMSDMLSYIVLVRRFSLSLPQNDRIYEETTMYYCVDIGCPDPLGWYRDKPEDKRFYATCCIESEPLYVKVFG